MGGAASACTRLLPPAPAFPCLHEHKGIRSSWAGAGCSIGRFNRGYMHGRSGIKSSLTGCEGHLGPMQSM